MVKNNHQTFQKRLEKVQKDISSSPISPAAPSFKSMAYRASTDMIAAIAVGCGLGIIVEHFFAVAPWGMIVGFFLGAVTGLLNVYRGLAKIGYGFRSERKDS